MVFHHINYAAVLVCIVASVVLGIVWYADPVFGKTWRRLRGVPDGAKPGMAPFAIWIVGAYLMAYTVYRVLIVREGVSSVGEGFMVGVLLALGLVIGGLAPNYAFAKSPVALAAIELGYAVVAILMMSVIVVAMG